MMRTAVLSSSMVAVAAILLVVPRCASAATYYVDPKGEDAGPGTAVDKPFRTIGKAASLVGPGDTVLIAPGRYVERVTVAASGTEKAPITFRGSGEGEVVLTTPQPDAAKWEEKYAFWVKSAKYVVVEGIAFKDCAAWILLDQSHYCTVRDCTFDGARIYNCSRINSGSNNRFLNCTFKYAIKREGFRTDGEWIPTPGADYIEIFRDSHANLVEGCRFGEINHVCVSISAVDPNRFKPSRNIVRNCTFTDPYWKSFWVHAGEHNVIEDCRSAGRSACFLQLESGSTIIRRNLFAGYRDSTGGKPDITLRGAVRMQYSQSQHNRIYHNVFWDNDRTLTNNSFRWEVRDNVFQNNIFFGNRQTVFLGFPEYRTKNRNYFLGNIMMGTKAGENLIRLEKDDYTLAEAQEKLPELYRGNLEADPQFVDAAKGDFRLKAGSPCIDRGLPLTTAKAAGNGRQIEVEDAYWFFDGAGMIPGDLIVVGAGGPVRVVRVDYDKKVLELEREIAWNAKDAVTLPFAGKAPDIGAVEFPPAAGDKPR